LVVLFRTFYFALGGRTWGLDKVSSVIARQIVAGWLKDALVTLGGSARIAQVIDEIYRCHRSEITGSGEFEQKWTYEVRWAADILRKAGIMKAARVCPKGVWELA
jgi:hypothetical protein